MVRIWIDDQIVETSAGTSVLTAARSAGVDIPALCHREGSKPNSSCLCCLVRVDGASNLVPACATTVRDGMRVVSEAPEVRENRRTALELLLADHAGDCHAPCHHTCPARMDIPNMLRHVADGDYRAAIAVVKEDIALPAVLGRVCPEVCEHACRRGKYDSPAAICRIKQFVADQDLATESPYQPPSATYTGKRVAVVGGGPAGLTAVYHLTRRGHQCTLIEQRQLLGGRLRDDFSKDELPTDVLEREIEVVLSRRTVKVMGIQAGEHLLLGELTRAFDAVLLATGRGDNAWLTECGVQLTNSGIAVDTVTRMTSQAGVFAAGNAVRQYKLVVQSVAEGKLAADCVDVWLRDEPFPVRHKHFDTRLGRLSSEELCEFCKDFPTIPRLAISPDERPATDAQFRQEAMRCLHCDCPALENCQLHHYAALYDCNARRFQGEGRRYEGKIIDGSIALEPGKCILCGICIDITRNTSDAVGLAFLGRSTQSRIGPPDGCTLSEALGSAVQSVIKACPTGAFTARQIASHLKAVAASAVRH